MHRAMRYVPGTKTLASGVMMALATLLAPVRRMRSNSPQYTSLSAVDLDEFNYAPTKEFVINIRRRRFACSLRAIRFALGAILLGAFGALVLFRHLHVR